MSKAFKLVPVALLAVVLFTPGDAQAQGVAGKWTAEYPMRVRMDNGVPSAEQMGTALLTLDVKGDSVFGTWQAQNTPAPVPPRSLKGTFSNGRINLVGDPVQAKIRRGGDESDTSSVMMTTYYEGTVKDGSIEGTMYSESSDQMIKSSPIKWTARRAADK